MKTLNTHRENDLYQVDTGPVVLPDLEKRHERAVDGIMQTAMDLLVRGRFADLARWIDALPRKRVTADPWLRLYRALTRQISGGKRTMEELAAVQGLDVRYAPLESSQVEPLFLCHAPGQG